MRSGVAVERWPNSTFNPGDVQALNSVGWVERSDTHQLQFCDADGLRKGLNPSHVLSSTMINAVLDKTYHQHQASARRYAGEALQDRIVDGANLIEAAAARDEGDGERLQKIAAEGAADSADEGVTQKSEAMFARGSRREMRAENARENLNNKIG
jgi:hypothetical protein